MVNISRRNSRLEEKLSHLKVTIYPILPMPAGPPHPSFPRTLMAYFLLTEDELDSMAHYYHQSTPGPWTDGYPGHMNWDKAFLAKPIAAAVAAEQVPNQQQSTTGNESTWLADLIRDVEAAQQQRSSTPQVPASPAPPTSPSFPLPPTANSYARLTDAERVRIKRRKFGKFIGFSGMETPAEEVWARVQASLERVLERGREQLQRDEDAMMGRRKLA